MVLFENYTSLLCFCLSNPGPPRVHTGELATEKVKNFYIEKEDVGLVVQRARRQGTVLLQ